MIKEFTIRPMFHYNANLKSDLFENNKEPLTMTGIVGQKQKPETETNRFIKSSAS